jgi:predicted transcriptional regulator YheO
MEKDILQQFVNIADGITTLLSPYAEAVIHDLETQEILHISNSFSKRDTGFPSNLEGMDFQKEPDVIGPYEKINWDSRRLKSVSIVLKDRTGNSAGLLCINLDISMADELNRVISTFISPKGMNRHPDNLFQNDWQEKVNVYVHNWAQENKKTIQNLTIEDKRILAEKLYIQGAFKNKKSHEYIAGVLNLSRATIFKYIKQVKGKQSG